MNIYYGNTMFSAYSQWQHHVVDNYYGNTMAFVHIYHGNTIFYEHLLW